MRMLQTESADIITLEAEYRITPALNIPVLLIKPPDITPELREAEQEKALPGDIDLILIASERNIDMLTHRTLVEESLLKYKDIWRTLADK